MPKKNYQKPEIKEVKLIMEDTFLTACRSGGTSITNARVNSKSNRRNCGCCRSAYTAS